MRLYNDQRPITILADGQNVLEDYRIRIKGSSNMTLLPDLFVVDVYNMPDDAMAQIRIAKYLAASGTEGSLFCYGEIQDIYTRQEDHNIVTSVVIADGQSFWESPITASYGAGMSVMQTILNMTKDVIPLGSFLTKDLKFPRGQCFDGKLAYAISDLAKAVNARAFVTNEALHVVAKGQATNLLTIPDDEILLDPAYADGICVLKTIVKGYPVGMLYEIEGKQWRLIKQVIEGDNQTGPWRSELTLVDENALSDVGMGGGI